MAGNYVLVHAVSTAALDSSIFPSLVVESRTLENNILTPYGKN
jgi:hypothetical protein